MSATCIGCGYKVKTRAGGAIIGDHPASWRTDAGPCWASGWPVAPVVDLEESRPVTKAGKESGWGQ